MHTFGHRLRVQKFVYLLQTFDIYLGYDYSWYLRGPYCSTLATSGFALAGFYGDIPAGARMSFSSSAVHGRFEDFGEFVGGREGDTDFLEVAATFHFLEKGAGLPSDRAFEKVSNRRPGFTEARCREVRSYLEEWGGCRQARRRATGARARRGARLRGRALQWVVCPGPRGAGRHGPPAL